MNLAFNEDFKTERKGVAKRTSKELQRKKLEGYSDRYPIYFIRLLRTPQQEDILL